MLSLKDFKTVSPDLLMATMGFKIYEDLKNDEPGVNLQPIYDENLNAFYLLNEERQAYVPILHTQPIDFRLIKRLQQKLENTIIFLAIVDNTTNILYYEMGKGFTEKTIRNNS